MIPRQAVPPTSSSDGPCPALWPVIGRPGAVLVDGEIVGTWRPRKSGKSLRVNVEPWRRASAAVKAAVGEQAERLAAHREVSLAGIDFAD